MRIHLERVAVVTATPHTTWTFAVLGDGEGTATTVEATLSSDPRQVIDALSGMVEALRGTDLAGEAQVEESLGLTRNRLRADTALAAAVSALRSAMAQLAAARSGRNLHRGGGGAGRGSGEPGAAAAGAGGPLEAGGGTR